MTLHSHHALSPRMAATVVQPSVQYNTSHRYSVSPLASRSSPDFFNSPFGPFVGRPIFSSQNSIATAGEDRIKYNRYVEREHDVRNTRKRREAKRMLIAREIKWVRLSIALLRIACCFAAFYTMVSIMPVSCSREHQTCAIIKVKSSRFAL